MSNSVENDSNYAEDNGIHCISDDCVYFAGGCGIKRVLLLKGICRYFHEKKGANDLDRLDLPENFMSSIR